jgi:exoribonuclease-2
MAPEKQAFEVLLAIGHFHHDSNLSFIRHEIPVVHEQGVLDEAAQVPMPRSVAEFAELERATRTDLSAMRCITIDDASTKDMDDALSLEQTQDGWQLGIHITDLTWAVHPDSKLERVARRRATSLYCADQTVNMLPELLSEHRLSLRAGELRACISVLVQLSSNFEVVTWQILPTCIRVAQRYTYEEVDHGLEQGDHLLLALHDIAAACEERRIRAGAVKVHRREAVPHLGPDGRVWLQEIDEESPARALVAEMMVLGNALMANFAADNGIPVLFRGQERMDDDRTDQDRAAPNEGSPDQDGSAGGEQSSQGREDAPAGPAKDYGVRAKMKKSTLSFSPQPHAGLGLSAYIQATSPIRRYIDICHQRQILSYLRTAQPWIDQESFERIAAEVENHVAAANSASRETRRYWLQRYLKQRGLKEPIEATVIRTDLKMPLVELDEVYLSVFARIPGKAQLGQRVRLKITALDPQADYFRLEVV